MDKDMEINKMEIEKYEAAIEAVLFVMGESVEIEKLAAAIEQDVETTTRIVHNMMDKYDSSDRGIKIIELENSYQMCTKSELYDALIRVAKAPKKQVLTDKLLETLSIVAYRQPVTKMEIEQIRGVNCDHSVQKLVEYNLITDVGRKEAPGRPLLYGTTEEFLRKFGVKSLEELPEVEEEVVESFKQEAEEELGQLKLDI